MRRRASFDLCQSMPAIAARPVNNQPADDVTAHGLLISGSRPRSLRLLSRSGSRPPRAPASGTQTCWRRGSNMFLHVAPPAAARPVGEHAACTDAQGPGGLEQQRVPITQGHLKWIGMKSVGWEAECVCVGGATPSGWKQGATHEKVIKQDAHQWMPQAEEAPAERRAAGRRSVQPLCFASITASVEQVRELRRSDTSQFHCSTALSPLIQASL